MCNGLSQGLQRLFKNLYPPAGRSQQMSGPEDDVGVPSRPITSDGSTMMKIGSVRFSLDNAKNRFTRSFGSRSGTMARRRLFLLKKRRLRHIIFFGYAERQTVLTSTSWLWTANVGKSRSLSEHPLNLKVLLTET